jgi:hypothetical protein
MNDVTASYPIGSIVGSGSWAEMKVFIIAASQGACFANHMII